MGSGGKGLQLFSSSQLLRIIDQSERRMDRIYVQEYLHNTLLLESITMPSSSLKNPITEDDSINSTVKVKFDSRIYFAITSLHPLRVWVHRVGFSRLTTREFSLKGEHASDPKRHIANIHFQEREKEWTPRSNSDACSATVRSWSVR